MLNSDHNPGANSGQARRRHALAAISEFKHEQLDRYGVLLAVGSIAYGGVHSNSDIDIMYISESRSSLLKSLEKLHIKLDSDALNAYDALTKDTYTIFNHRLDLSNIPSSCIFLDIEAIKALANPMNDRLFQFRTRIPTTTRILQDFLGRSISLPITIRHVGNYQVCDYHTFYNNMGIYAYGSLASKLVHNPLIIGRFSQPLLDDFLSCLSRVYRLTNLYYVRSLRTDRSCFYLKGSNRAHKFDGETLRFLESQVFVRHKPSRCFVPEIQKYTIEA